MPPIMTKAQFLAAYPPIPSFAGPSVYRFPPQTFENFRPDPIPIAYEPHPCSPARKAFLRAQGWVIVDEIYIFRSDTYPRAEGYVAPA